jgi:hypothetical protein
METSHGYRQGTEAQMYRKDISKYFTLSFPCLFWAERPFKAKGDMVEERDHGTTALICGAKM